MIDTGNMWHRIYLSKAENRSKFLTFQYQLSYISFQKMKPHSAHYVLQILQQHNTALLLRRPLTFVVFFSVQQINPRFWFYIGSDVRPILQNQGCPVSIPTQSPSSRNVHETIVRVVLPKKPKDKEMTSSKDKTDHSARTSGHQLPESHNKITLPDPKSTNTMGIRICSYSRCLV